MRANMTNVKFRKGYFSFKGREVDVTDRVLPLAQEFKIGVRGGYVTVDGKAVAGYPDRNIKVYVTSEQDYETVTDSVAATGGDETDAQIIERLRDRFDMLTDMTKAVKKGDVRAMIVSGPPGVGKSHGVEQVLERYKMMETLGGTKKYEVVKGAMSPIGLYVKLFKYADKDNVLVFDDCDSIFDEPLALNILKAALDSKKTRTIHWNTDSFKLRNEGVPDSFKFEGSAIFITNIKFDNVKSKKLRDHLEALESRCHYIDLTIDSERDKMLRIKQIVGDGMLDSHALGDEVTTA